MNKLFTMMAVLSLGNSVPAQPQEAQTRRPRTNHQLRQSPHRQVERQRRQRAQQLQLNQERLRAEHGWQLHPRPDAQWEERQREYELKREFKGGR